MPSTYTNNGGLELPGDGEQSGDWGDTVNTNMQILDAITNGQVTLSLSGTSSTLTTSNAPTLSDGQNALIVLGGSPSGTHTITVAPNDAEKIYFVYNTTAQSVIFTQGSGGNVTVATGDSAIIYANGGGASAAVANLTDHFAMSSVKITGGSISGASVSTSSATITGGSITGITDLAVADGGTGASTAAQALINFGLTATATELNYVDGVTSAIQTQMDLKAPLASPTLTTPTTTGTVTINGGTQSWTVVPSGTNLTFAYNGVNKMRLDSSGNITVTGNVTAYGTIT